MKLQGVPYFSLVLRLSSKLKERYRMNVYNLGYRLIGSLDGYPLPPPNLLDLVIATKEVAWYQLGGFLAHEGLVVFLRRNGLDINSFKSIYDFGCGCGRITRWLSPLKDGCEILATDYNSDLVAWCNKNLGSFAQFRINGPNPPLEFESEKFDLVHCYSVYSHSTRSANCVAEGTSKNY